MHKDADGDYDGDEKPSYDTATQTFRKKHKPKPNAKAPLGQGGRFAALKNKLAHKPGVTDPGALAASIGRKKYGAKKMGEMSHHEAGGE